MLSINNESGTTFDSGSDSDEDGVSGLFDFEVKTLNTDTPSGEVPKPNGVIQTVGLEPDESTELSVPVMDGETVTVYRWGGYTIPSMNVPSGLEVQLVDSDGTVVSSDETSNTVNSDGIVSYENSSGSAEIVMLTIKNNTDTAYDSGSDSDEEGIGGIFDFEVR